MLMALTATAVFAAAAVAVAQSVVPVVSVAASVSPEKGGTKKKPRNASTTIKFDVNPESNSTLAGVDYGLPSTLKVSGVGFPKCSATTINTKGESACPKKSKVGTGAATALLGPGKTPITFAVNVYTNGSKALVLALKQNGGAVQVAFDAKYAKNRLAFSIPPNVQQPAPGLYSYVTSVTANLGPATGRKTVKKKVKVKVKGRKKKKKVTKKVKVKTFLVSRTGCAVGGDAFDVKLALAANPAPPAVNPAMGATTSACTK